MNRKLILAALLCTATPALAQNTNVQGQTSTSNSGAAADSGSISGAQSNNTANNNAGIGSSQNENTSTSNSGAVSGSTSGSTSNSNGNTQGQDQGQSQGQSANNTQGQNQNASSDQGQMQAQDQTASNANSQGVTVNQTWNTKNRRETEVRTNNAVPLASSSSFSSDYCGGSVSAGGSSAPLGISIGVAAPKFDKSCQSLRRAEKFGMAAVNAMNMGQPDLGGRLMSMMIWSICTSDSAGPDAGRTTADACDKLLLLGAVRSQASAAPMQPLAGKAREARVAVKGQITAEAATKARDDQQQVASATVAK